MAHGRSSPCDAGTSIEDGQKVPTMDLIPVSTRNFIRHNRPFISDAINVIHVCPLTWRKLLLDVVQTGLSINQHERLYDTYSSLLLQLPIGTDGRTFTSRQMLPEYYFDCYHRLYQQEVPSLFLDYAPDVVDILD